MTVRGVPVWPDIDCWLMDTRAQSTAVGNGDLYLTLELQNIHIFIIFMQHFDYQK